MSLQASQYALYGLQDVDLNPQQRIVLILIADHVNGETGWAWMSIQRLAQYSGMKERAIQRALRGLRDAGILEVIERPGKTNMYRILTDRGVTNDTPTPVTGDTPQPSTPVTNDTPTPVTNDTPSVQRGVTNDTGGVSPVTPEPRKNLNQEDDDDDGARRAEPRRLTGRVQLAAQIIPETWTGIAIVCDDPRLDVLDDLAHLGWTPPELRAACAHLPKPRANPTGLLARHLQGLADTNPDHLALPRPAATPGPSRPAECAHGAPVGGGCYDCDQEAAPWTA